ncbi:MAG TPA: phospholipase C, phosphocholine-specific, partial [Arenibacter sp.]|nr:phospholipase C, phosphocholine-specific [Arenibacter sp.]
MTTFPPSIQRALSIDPEKGSTFYDAEHVVLLMQENRSFDHSYGTLQGVRGFNDPRAISLPNKIPVWLQSNKQGETFVPFRLNIKDTKATWMGSLPHSWDDQVDARNNGKYDQWLEAKRPGNEDYRHMPLTMGYYNREDIPFYYNMADAFTVFDQHFCSSLTGTTANRNFFWTGKTWESATSKSCVRNSDVYYNKEAHWKTFPERLEEHGISWMVYQNELSLQTELEGEDKSLLSNFTNNNLEWFSQYNVRYSAGHQHFLKKRLSELPSEIEELENTIGKQPVSQVQKLQNTLDQKKNQLEKIKEDLKRWSPENFEKLSELEKNLHRKGLAINTEDPHYHETETLTYLDGGVERSVKVPKGDILHQFREDVDNDRLPTVSWLVAPKNFSDHPSAPWYGAWYVSEVLDILTKNPEIWKKTIFILTYDENDGYFDHVPPFVAPDPKDKGAVSKGIDTTEEYVTLEEERAKDDIDQEDARESPIGLGYRVPMVIASPWSKGGWVNSEVCDISSTLMFLEKFLNKKTNKHIEETNISKWRRTICGDLTSSFRTFDGKKTDLPEFLERNAFMQEVYNASFKEAPSNFVSLSPQERERAAQD